MDGHPSIIPVTFVVTLPYHITSSQDRTFICTTWLSIPAGNYIHMYIRVMPIQHITDTTFSERVFLVGPTSGMVEENTPGNGEGKKHCAN